jgi:hypothetical protein
MTIVSYRPKSLALLALSLVLICSLAPVALQAQKKAQPQKKAKELRIDEVTVRDGSNRVTTKQGFEFVSAGKNRVTVRRANADTTQTPSIKGSYICACTSDNTGVGLCEMQQPSSTGVVCSGVKCTTCVLQITVK